MVKFNGQIVEQHGDFVLQYGYDSSMDLLNVIGRIETTIKTEPKQVGKTIEQMRLSGVPKERLANFLANYYHLFGW